MRVKSRKEYNVVSEQRLSVGIAAGIFLYTVLSEGIAVDSLAFTQALAQLYAQIIAAIIMAIIAATVIGALILAILALIDAVIALICHIVEGKASWVEEWICGGFSGLFGQTDYLCDFQPPPPGRSGKDGAPGHYAYGDHPGQPGGGDDGE